MSETIEDPELLAINYEALQFLYAGVPKINN
jgi:hypothetical protein